mmetsp:Transcript_22217/g.25521  ORF Transcript_22217/g.25521 Transcript_22217/m.25521 type:complete len:110 (+) Transcript_22217:935-1264(+)
MGASFRNSGEIINLAGCDRLTIAPKLLEELNNNFDEVELKLDAKKAKKDDSIAKVNVTEKLFRWEMNQDAMATDKLSDGIRKFSQDLDSLEKIIKEKLTDFIKSKPKKK